MIDEKQSCKVFLSYPQDDREWVTEFASTLRNQGINTWLGDIDIKPGENWRTALEEALRESNILVMVLSPSDVNSPWTYFELGAAIADKKRIIPVIAEDMDMNQIPLLVRNLQMLRRQSPIEAGKLVAKAIAA